MRRIFIILLSYAIVGNGYTQPQASIEQYHLVGRGQEQLLMPVASYQTATKWYAEARYNYEDIKTFSLLFGRTFSQEKDFSYSFTPLIGGAAGNFNGISTGLNMELGYGSFFWSSQSQYSFSTDNKIYNFFYNWSDLAYQPFDYLYAGLSMQQTKIYRANGSFEPGVLVGFNFRKLSIPLYAFNPLDRNRYFVVGVNLEWK